MTLTDALREINSQLGKEIIVKPKELEYIPTGFTQLDKVIQGYPKGRIIEMYGNESGGKSTLALNAIVEAQKLGIQCVYIDLEHSYSGKYAELIGVDNDKLILACPMTAEETFDLIKIFAEDGSVGLVVLDSIANLVPKAMLDAKMEKETMGLQARALGKGLRKVTGYVSKSKMSLICINQIREKIGVMFGNPETTPGGRALKFYASIRMSVRSGERLKSADNTEYGHVVNVKIEKSKVGGAKESAQLMMIHGLGLSKPYDRLLGLQESGEIVKEGGWYKWKGKKYREAELLKLI